MAIFQKSVIQKHLSNLDKKLVEKAYQKFRENFSPAKIAKIKQLKEEEYQDGFLRDLFVDVFGYTLKPDDNYDLVREFKNQADGRKADGAIIRNNEVSPVAIAVIELKSTKTKDFYNVTEQAFGYKNNQPECKYVIISNFQKLRFYVDYANEYEEFDLFQIANGSTDGLTRQFELLYLLLNTNSIFSDLPLKLKNETKFHEQEVSGKLYKEYSNFKNKLFEDLIKNNLTKRTCPLALDKLILFKKSQKLLDRFLFILFAEDSGLLPPNSISRIIDTFNKLEELDAYKPIYDIFKQYFGYMNIGRKGKTNTDNIPAYNGGLFYPDELLDSLIIDDTILIDGLLRLSEYDFNTEVDVNILGHIFEHSLSEIEEISAELSADTRGHAPLALSKRKKDGVFYTPKYITQYIVENTIGTLCTGKRKELEIEEIEFDGTYKTKYGNLSAKGKKLYQKLNDYKDWMLSLKIVDPACGSGAFLNQALNFLIQEHENIDDIIAELTNTALRLFDTDKAILENNLYGVDINDESVEIAKLSLWLRTAQKGRKLSNLNHNIKCGNSLIDDPEVAGEKAFDWNKEFPQIFTKKKKKAWHITTATHNSRYSQRMFDHHVKPGEAVWISEKDEIIVAKTIAGIVTEDNLNIIECNICGDHMHILLVCEEEDLPRIVGKLKAVSSRKYNIENGITVPAKTDVDTEYEGEGTRGHVPLSGVPLSGNDTEAVDTGANSGSSTTTKKEKKKYNSLWTQKFGKRKINGENDLQNVRNYIRTNRQKHELPENKKLEKIISEITCTVDHAFRAEYKGGFDVVIGNPPYGVSFNKDQKKYLSQFDPLVPDYEIYIYFISLATDELLKEGGWLSYIFPNTFLSILYGKNYRQKIIDNFKLQEIVDLSNDNTFVDASVRTCILTLKNEQTANYDVVFKKVESDNSRQIVELNKHNNHFLKQNIDNWLSVSSYSKIENQIVEKIKQHKVINDYFKVSQGYIPYRRSDLVKEFGNHGNDIVDKRLWHSNEKVDKEYKQEIFGKNLFRYYNDEAKSYIKYGKHLACYVNPKFFDNKRILVREITSKTLNCNYVEKSLYNNPSIINIISEYDILELKYALTILNSKLIGWYHNTTSPKAKKGLFPKILVNDVRNLPIKETPKEAQQPFIKKADKMLFLNQQLQEKKNKFLNRVKDNLGATAPTRGHAPLAVKISKKLDSFYNYDFKTFIAELKKQKVKLSLVQQDEWEEYFTAYKNEINQLQNEIDTTDKEIDRMVYELYGLTEEEIEIVENS